MPSWRRCGHNRLRLTAAHSRVSRRGNAGPRAHTVVSSYIVPHPLDGVTALLHLRITQRVRCHHGSTHNADLPWEARSGAQPLLHNYFPTQSLRECTKFSNALATSVRCGAAQKRLDSPRRDDENGGSLVRIFALAHEHDPDPEMRSYEKPVSVELREKLIIGGAAAVMRIYRYFQERRFTATYATGNSTTDQRVTPKVGRNEPCPCGSGKKYKQCCGRDHSALK
jgi:SEC-C motif